MRAAFVLPWRGIVFHLLTALSAMVAACLGMQCCAFDGTAVPAQKDAGIKNAILDMEHTFKGKISAKSEKSLKVVSGRRSREATP